MKIVINRLISALLIFSAIFTQYVYANSKDETLCSKGDLDLSTVKLKEGITSLLICYNDSVSNLGELKLPLSLKYLSFSNNKISDISELKLTEKLVSLSIRNERIVDVSSLSLTNNLLFLDLSGNQISDLSSLKLGDKLSSLDISDNELTSIENIKFNTNLKELQLEDNPITHFKSSDFNESLEGLTIGSYTLTSLEGLSFPPNLRYLDLYSGIYGQGFTGVNGDLLPASVTDLRLNTTGYSNYSDVINIPSTVKKLSMQGYHGITDYSDLVLPDTIDELNMALGFVSDADLATLTLPMNLKKLNLYKNNLRNLQQLQLPSSVEFLDLRMNFINARNQKLIKERFKDVTIRFGRQRLKSQR